ncbi:PPE family protein [Mycolicibacterium setense]|uniref:PPE family protein n=1 Tax=Mycolicibacterium setense TaxID=431269 RepID=UPI000AAB6F54|nr:PPE domain-containing protein [Mycolicibacterium setense]
MIADFWALPPEVNSFRLSSGAGPAAHAPEIAAYQAVGTTHAEQSIQQMVTTAATAPSWQGAGGTGMVTTSTPLAGYNALAAAHAEKAAGMIAGMAAAYTGAVAGSMHYSVCIANRVRDAVLESTNILGINTIPIAETEAEYTGFWGQNAAASTGYEVESMPLVTALQVPLTPSPMGANPGGVAAAMFAVGVQGATTAAHALGAGLSEGMAAAAQTVGTTTGAVTGATSALAGQAPAAAQSPGSGTTAPGTGTQPGATPAQAPGDPDMLSAAQAMSGSVMQAPTQAIQSATGSLGQGGQMFSSVGQVGSLGSSLINPAALGGSGLNSPAVNALSAGPSGASGIGGGNGGFAAGGGVGAINAALTKPTAGGPMAGTVGLPGNWWGKGDKVPVAGPSETTTVARGASAAGAPGMYGGMAPAAAAARGQGSGSRELSEADKQVVMDGLGDGMPVFTDTGVVFASGQGV